MPDEAILAAIAVSTGVAVWLAVGLWRSDERVVWKILWTLGLLVPIFGPILFQAMREIPPPKSRALIEDEGRFVFWGRAWWEYPVSKYEERQVRRRRKRRNRDRV